MKNRLLYVSDGAGTSTGTETDFPNQSSGNYSYDAIGQLTTDTKDGLTYEYYPDGLTKNIKQGGVIRAAFEYNHLGLRQRKITYAGGEATTYTWYIYDPAGALVSTYSTDIGNDTTIQEDMPLYAGGRVGMLNKNAGRYAFELTDHLGNVRAVVAKEISSNLAEVLSFTDYYAGGGVLPGRNYVSSPAYRLGFQGQEKDGETNFYNFELRQYDPRLMRWFNPDPMGQFFSPYLAMGNNPNLFVDPNGGQIYEVDGEQYTEWQYNMLMNGNGGNIASVNAGGTAYGSHLGYSYNGQYYLGSHGYDQAYNARKKEYEKYVRDRGWSPGKHGYYQQGSMFKDSQGNLTVDANGIGGLATAYLYEDITEWLGLSNDKLEQGAKEKGFWDKVDESLGAGLYGSVENYRAVQKHAGDDNPYMYTKDEMGKYGLIISGVVGGGIAIPIAAEVGAVAAVETAMEGASATIEDASLYLYENINTAYGVLVRKTIEGAGGVLIESLPRAALTSKAFGKVLDGLIKASGSGRNLSQDFMKLVEGQIKSIEKGSKLWLK